MTIHLLRKFFGLALVYIVIIFGIFAMQFRNESSVFYLTDTVKVVLTQIREAPFRNRIEITFPGVRISVHERSPAFLQIEGRRIPLALESWELLSDTSAVFNFDNNARLTLMFEPGTERVTFSGELPPKTQLILPFQTAGGYSVTHESPARTIIASRDQMFSLIPGVTGQREIVIPADNSAVSYSPHIDKQEFSYENSLDSPLAGEISYDGVVTGTANRLIGLFGANADSDGEQTVVSYITAMGAQGRYAQAVSSVPESFTSSRGRTYLSAPYFGSLIEMDDSLAAQNANLHAMMAYAVQRSSLDFFTVPDLADYLLREADSQSVRAFLSIPAAAPESAGGRLFEPSVSEAAGILNTYAALASAQQSSPAAPQSREYAGLLEPVLGACLETIAAACSLDGGILTLFNGPVTEGAEPLELLQAADVGMALINYGAARNQLEIKRTGYFIINSLDSEVSDLDLRESGMLYPRFAGSSGYYPHSTVLALAPGRKIWAWSIARRIEYAADSRGDVTITVDFPSGNSHYLIFKGIAPFRSIEIAGSQTRANSRFENSDSSGYEYDERKQTLYVKLSQRAERETIRIVYYTPPRAAPSPAPVAAPPAELPVLDVPAGNVLQSNVP